MPDGAPRELPIVAGLVPARYLSTEVEVIEVAAASGLRGVVPAVCLPIMMEET